jgi:uncharacterized FAD-dependent dehydrogenase
MCPGGSIIPASAYNDINVVNGMSLYNRDGKYANAACVAGVDLNRINGKEIAPLETLDWLAALEAKFYEYSDGFKAPFCGIKDFIKRKAGRGAAGSSYPLGLKPAALWELLPYEVSDSIREGLKDFSRKIRGFDEGIIEGSGYSGGIISSAADGIKTAMAIIKK